ncbi:hypothetical protein GALMADRAFT_148648 [Galerina marginata CBS 339.88]|uniref:Uncharacterized protein n=1 Tax=Galerina marginata (strain CBS 339.88) TaxID=685588 RepID=A0A067SFI1_GALM3|nr:hypothetical protein GALMADRAFT_148648 [Galerina marginata CBS 339.88]
MSPGPGVNISPSDLDHFTPIIHVTLESGVRVVLSNEFCEPALAFFQPRRSAALAFSEQINITIPDLWPVMRSSGIAMLHWPSFGSQYLHDRCRCFKFSGGVDDIASSMIRPPSPTCHLVPSLRSCHSLFTLVLRDLPIPYSFAIPAHIVVMIRWHRLPSREAHVDYPNASTIDIQGTVLEPVWADRCASPLGGQDGQARRLSRIFLPSKNEDERIAELQETAVVSQFEPPPLAVHSIDDPLIPFLLVNREPCPPQQQHQATRTIRNRTSNSKSSSRLPPLPLPTSRRPQALAAARRAPGSSSS